ncbi:MAG TPA: DUF4199 domain-containing protein [Chitinophagaceae bacterium]|nr:DUF4199 domain-containing protein [Chitinophagaceae bacterium]
MPVKLAPAVKGIITAFIMIAIALWVYYADLPPDSAIQYLIYLAYASGILWTLIAYRRSPAFTGKFGDLFSQGFRCFIIVILCIIFFYWLFNYLHPEFRQQMADTLRKQLTDAKDKMPSDIEKDVAAFKKQYVISLISRAIFGYLIIGAGVTAAASALLTRRKN